MALHRSFAIVVACALARPATAQEPPEPEPAGDIQVIALEHADATALANTLRQLVQKRLAADPGARRHRTVVAPHATSNSLLVSADETTLKQIQRLVAELDVPAKDPEPERVDIALDGDEIRLKFGDRGQISVADLTRLAQRMTGKIYKFDARRVGSRTIQLIGTLRIDRSEFGALFRTLLHVHGLTLVNRDEGGTTITEIVDATEEAGDSQRFVPLSELQADAQGDVLTMVELSHTNARQLVNDLQRFVDAPTRIGAVGNDRTVLIRGSATHVLETARLIQRADDAARVQAKTSVVRLEHTDAGRVASTLMQLLGVQGPQSPNPTTRSFRAVAAGGDALVITGAEDLVATALGVIAELDSERR